MDKLKYLQPIWWTASLILLMLHVMTKGTAMRINLDFSKIFKQVLQYVDSVQGEAIWGRVGAAEEAKPNRRNSNNNRHMQQSCGKLMRAYYAKKSTSSGGGSEGARCGHDPMTRCTTGGTRWAEQSHMLPLPEHVSGATKHTKQLWPGKWGAATPSTLVNVAAEGQLLTARRQESQGIVLTDRCRSQHHQLRLIESWSTATKQSNSRTTQQPVGAVTTYNLVFVFGGLQRSSAAACCCSIKLYANKL